MRCARLASAFKSYILFSVFLLLSLLSEPSMSLPSSLSSLTFKRVRTQFIAALGDPSASSGTGAEQWGIWPLDPGPRGVRLSSFANLAQSGRAPRFLH